MIVSNVKVYDLKESIIASGYPMRESLNVEGDSENLSYWLEYNLSSIMSILKNDDRFYLDEDELFMKVTDAYTTEISPENLVEIAKHRWTSNGKYIYMIDSGEMLHRFLLGDEFECIDHINRDTFDNRRENLRFATKQENSYNAKTPINNSSGIIGVSYSKERDLWRAYITVDSQQMYLGRFESIEDAIRSRLLAEVKYCGEFSPQKHLFKKYNIQYTSNSIEVPSISNAIQSYKRMITLSKSRTGSGHDQALTGITVNFDLTFTNKAWVELERYNFIKFVSSQSTMHRIAKFELSQQYIKYVDKRMIKIMEELKNTYNKTQDKEDYLRLLYSNPSGFQLTARLTTNYRALKTVYSQRLNHRLPEWREFCKWVETLPYAKELITNGE